MAGEADPARGGIGQDQLGGELIDTNVGGGATKNPVVTSEDDSFAIYMNDADLSIEYATPIEIRGPPASEADSVELGRSSFDIPGAAPEGLSVQALAEVRPYVPDQLVVAVRTESPITDVAGYVSGAWWSSLVDTAGLAESRAIVSSTGETSTP